MESQHKQLIRLKLIHTVIWIFFAGLIFYIDYAAIANQITRYTWYAIGMVFVEVVILITFRWSCPITILAREYTEETNANFDIYLPNWLAKNNKLIFGTLYISGIILTLIRVYYFA